MNPKRLHAYLSLLGAAIIWGAAAPIIKFTLQGIDPLPFLAYRFAIASVFSLTFFTVKINQGKKFRQLRNNLPMAILYSVLAVPIGLGMLFLALDKTTVLDLTLVGVIAPIVTGFGASYFFHDHITKREKVGISVVLIGVIFNSLFPIFLSDSSIRITGNILLFAYLLADSASLLLAKKSMKNKIKSSNLTNFAFIIGGITIIPIALFVYGFTPLLNLILNLDFKYHLGVWYMALLSGNLAYFLQVRGSRSIEVSEASLFSYLQPVVMIPLAILWLHESLNLHFIIGAVLIVIGLVIAETKKKRYTNSR